MAQDQAGDLRADPSPPVVAADSSEPGHALRLRRLVPAAIAVSVLSIVALMVWYQGRRDVDILASLKELDLAILPLALGLHILAHVIWATRLWLLAGGLGAPLSWPRALVLVLAGQFGAAVTPGRFGAEALRITLLVRGGSSGPVAGRVVVADRATDTLFFVTLGGIAAASLPLLFGEDAVVLRGLAFVAVAGLSLFIALIVLMLVRPQLASRMVHGVARGGARIVRRPEPKIAAKVEAFLVSVREGLSELARRSPWRLGAAAGLSFALWTSEFSILWIVLGGFGHEVPFQMVFIAGVLLTMLAAVPVSPGGSGVAEFAALVLLTPLAPGLTPAFVLVWRAMTYYYDLLVGGIVAAAVLPRAGPRIAPGTEA